MSILAKIRRGNAAVPHRIVVAGPEGIGKSTLAAGAPKPLFIAAEDGLTGLEHVKRISPSGLNELYEILDALIVSVEGHETIVIDTVDWMERMIYDGICSRDSKSNIEDYGYGKGYTVAEAELVKILGKLDQIRTSHNVWIILLSHVEIKTFQDPRGDSWDRYQMKGNKRMTGILREWPDACLFATYEVFKTKEKGSQREKAIGGERKLQTQWTPAWDAKNRLGLPEQIPLSWEALIAEIKSNSPDALREKVKALYSTAKIPEDRKAAWTKFTASLSDVPPEKLRGAIEKLTELQ
jgi:hypothetical protein